MKQRRISELDSVLHLQEILRGVYPEFIESAQNDSCETCEGSGFRIERGA